MSRRILDALLSWPLWALIGLQAACYLTALAGLALMAWGASR